MTATGTGLSDIQRTWLAIAIGVFMTVAVSIAGLPDNTPGKPPAYVLTALTITAAAIGAFERLSGIRDATTARVSKEVDGNLPQFREPPD